MSFISIIVLHSRIHHLLTYFNACSYKRSQVASKSSSIKSSTHTRQFSTLVMPSILTRRHRTQTTSTSRTRWATPWPRASTSSRTTATSSNMLRSLLNDSILKRRTIFFIRIYQLALSFFHTFPKFATTKNIIICIQNRNDSILQETVKSWRILNTSARTQAHLDIHAFYNLKLRIAQ